MAWFRAVAREVWGLFVDDGSFAAAILSWVVVAVLLARLTPGAWWVALLLFGGLAGILIHSALRFARRRGR
jgi:membrane protein implicated in regulation of membrane protease activity